MVTRRRASLEDSIGLDWDKDIPLVISELIEARAPSSSLGIISPIPGYVGSVEKNILCLPACSTTIYSSFWKSNIVLSTLKFEYKGSFKITLN